MEYLALLFLAPIPAYIAKNKGHSFGMWLVFGALLWIVAMPASLFLRSVRRKCPKCAEMILPDATVCRFCHSEIGALSAAEKVAILKTSKSESGAAGLKGLAVVVAVVAIAYLFSTNQATSPSPAVEQANSGQATKSLPEPASSPQVAPVTPSASSDALGKISSFDSDKYCKEIADNVGGSYQIEKTCRDAEGQALQQLQQMSIPQRIATYCSETAQAVGGSYQIALTCVHEEEKAKAAM